MANNAKATTTAEQIALEKRNLLEAQKKAAERIKKLQMKEQERICKIMDKLHFLKIHHTDDELAAMFKDQLAKKGNGHAHPSATQ